MPNNYKQLLTTELDQEIRKNNSPRFLTRIVRAQSREVMIQTIITFITPTFHGRWIPASLPG